MSRPELQALLPCPDGVRSFTHERVAGFADVAPSGRMRLDAIARWMQDVAWADIEDTGLHTVTMWVTRRTRIRVNRWPRFGEHFAVTTYCTGLGRMWAERRTDIVRDGVQAADVEGVSIWVHLDPERQMPSPVSDAEIATYTGPGTRAVSARLRHPAAPAEGSRDAGAWTFRAVDLDIAGHVNNAVYWAPLEEELLVGAGAEPERFDAELEYRTPAQAGVKRVLAAGDRRWIVDAGGDVHASVVVR